MQANTGDILVVCDRSVGQGDHVVEILEVLGSDGSPPYRVRTADGQERVMSPGPDSVVEHRKASA